MTSRRALLAALSTAVLLGLAWGCAAATDSGNDAHAGGGSNSNFDASNDGQVIMQEAGPQDSGQLHLNPLCGEARGCVPDLPRSCADFTPPAPASEDGGTSPSEAGANGQAGANGEGGTAGDSAGPSDSSAGASGAGGASGAAGEGGAAGAAGAPSATTPDYSCQVQRTASAPRKPFFACALAGTGAENAPCLTSNDCQAGLGCVGDQNAGLCQKYCCQDANDCESGSYCAERPMRDALTNAAAPGTSNTQLSIPVCVHAENCDLSEPYPCPRTSDCTCRGQTACLVVRSDGTTTCAVPGTGKVGEACPCAWGYVCSAAANECLKLCYTRDADSCGDGKCQSASELPNGWGVCVGAPPSGR